jgi:hypothetical protein
MIQFAQFRTSGLWLESVETLGKARNAKRSLSSGVIVAED